MGALLFSRFKLDEKAHGEIRAALDQRSMDQHSNSASQANPGT